MPRKNTNAIGKVQGLKKKHPSVVVERKPASVRVSISVGDIITPEVRAQLMSTYRGK